MGSLPETPANAQQSARIRHVIKGRRLSGLREIPIINCDETDKETLRRRHKTTRLTPMQEQPLPISSEVFSASCHTRWKFGQEAENDGARPAQGPSPYSLAGR